MKHFTELLQVALGNRIALSDILSSEEWAELMAEAQQQAVLGVLFGGLERLPDEQKPPKSVLVRWIAYAQIIMHRNSIMDDAVISLCQKTKEKGLDIIVFKGQTLAVLYPDGGLRQSGDIDFYVRKEDWKIAIESIESKVESGVITDYRDKTTEKDIQFEFQDVTYEMHRMMISLASPRHRKYWEHVIMPEILAHPWFVKIKGYDILTLAPTYNILYVFAHIFEHLIMSGIGLRQFCDLYYLMTTYKLADKEVAKLRTHLERLGLKKAFTGICAILTDYFGMEKSRCPLTLTKEDHLFSPILMKNIMKMGNFGHKKHHSAHSGIRHGVQRLGQVISQVRLFGHLAPNEAWWRIPYMVQWRIKRVWRKII